MAYEQITYERIGHVAVLTMNRPEKLNAWTQQMGDEQRTAIEEANADPGVGAIVLTGAGRAFCAGADISIFARDREALDGGAKPEASRMTEHGKDWVTFVRTSKKPTIAAINGVAVGIGVTSILPFDFRIASEQARIGMFFVRMALVPELASSAILGQMVGIARAIDWCLTGRMIAPEEAREAGLVSEVVAPERLLPRALELGETLARQPLEAMGRIRELFYTNYHEADIATVMRSEGAALLAARRSPEHLEAITAFFEKREPTFTR